MLVYTRSGRDRIGVESIPMASTRQASPDRPAQYTWLIRFRDGSIKRAARAYHTESGARAVMEATLTRLRPERLMSLEATAVVRR